LPAADAIHVWRSSLALDDRGYERLHDTLSVDERERASNFLFDRDRRCFVAARGMLREILGRYLGIAPRRRRIRLGALG
jgi:4'-phosphopantetheinyl transferase